jgi:hypothetical protein
MTGSFPHTAAGQCRIHTGFPFHPKARAAGTDSHNIMWLKVYVNTICGVFLLPPACYPATEYDQPGFTPAACKPLVVEHGQLIAIDAGEVLLHFGRVGFQEGFEAGAVLYKRNVRGLPRWRVKIDSARDREVALRRCRSLRLDPDSL